MKNLNLDQLLMSWNEKLKPQRFRRYAVMLMMLLTLGVGQMWGKTVTVYATVWNLFDGSWDESTSTMKLDVNSSSGWSYVASMTKMDYTYKGYPVFKYDITTASGIQISHFKHYKGNTFQADYTTGGGIASWTESTDDYNNKLYIGYVNGEHRWIDLCKDGDIYFVKNGDASSWEYCWAHAWNGSYNTYTTTWHGAQMSTDGGKTYDGAPIYKVTFNNPPYSKVIFNDGSSNQLAEESIPMDNRLYRPSTDSWYSYAFDHTATVSAGTHGDVSPKGSGTVIYVSGRSITATPDEHYVFDKWTASGGGISPTSSTTNPQTFTATSDGGTITASFSDRWVIAGIAEDGSTTPDFGYYRGLPNTGTNTHSTSFILAEGDYKLKIFDRKENKWYTDNGATINRANNSKTADDVNTGDNMTLHVDLAGSYTFTFNTSSELLTVTYPTYTEALTSMSVAKGSYVLGGDGSTSGNTMKIYNSMVSSANFTMTVSPTSSSQGGTIKYAIGSSEKGTVSSPQAIAASTISLTTDAVQYTFKAYFKKGTYKSTGAEQTVSYYIQKTTDPAVTLATQINSANASDADLATEPTISLVASVTNNLIAVGSNFTYYVKTPGSADWEVVASSAGTSTTYTPEAIGEYKFKVKWTHQRDWESSEQTFVVWKNYTIYVWDPSNWAKYVHIWKGEVSKYTWGNASEAMTSKSGDWGTGWYSFNIEYPKWTNFKVHLNDATSLPQSQSVEYAFTQEPLVENNNVYFRCTNESDKNWGLSSIEEPQKPEITITNINVYATKLVVDVAIDNHYSLLTYHGIVVNGESKDGSRTGSVTNVGGGTYRYTLTDLDENTEYTFRASATNGLGTTNEVHSVHTLAKMPIKFIIKVSAGLMGGSYWGANSKTTIKLKYYNSGSGYFGTEELTRKASDANWSWYEYTFEDSPVSFYVCNANNDPENVSGSNRSSEYINATSSSCTEVINDLDGNSNHKLRDSEDGICGTHYKLQYFNGKTTTESNVTGDADDKMSLFIGAYNSGSPAGRWLKLFKYTTGWNAGTNVDLATLNLADSAVYVVSLKEDVDFEDATTTDWDFEIYTGNYYIRTDKADGGWNNYKGNSNLMTYSDYSSTLSSNPYTHYWMKWVQGDNDAGRNVKFDVANDYNKSLANGNAGFDSDGYANGTGQIKQNANVRFMYNATTNKLSRAYLSGSSSQSDLFLVLRGNASNCLYTKQDKSVHHTTNGTSDWAFFKDDNNWVYQVDAYAVPGTRIKLTAQMTNSSGSAQQQSFKGDASNASFDEEYTDLLIGGTGTDAYHMRIIYDFKINRLVTAWLPTSLSQDLGINADVMLIREGQEEADQITLNDHTLSDVHTVYAVMQFNRWRLNNRANPEDMTVSHCAINTGGDTWVYDETTTNTHHPALYPGDEGYLPKSARDIYWVSFPFDVNLNDVFGSVGTYGIHWGIEKYYGDERAKKGYWADSDGFWKLLPNTNQTLKAYEGYLLVLDLDYFGYSNTTTWTSNLQQIELYFPSASNAEHPIQIATNDVKVEFDQTDYICTIDRRSDADKENNVVNINKDRRIADSYWHVIGVPSFSEVSHPIIDGDKEDPLQTDDEEVNFIDRPAAGSNWQPGNKLYLYVWDWSDNSYSVETSGSSFTFKPMHAYMVQYGGDTLWWRNASKWTSQVPARTRKLADYDLKLELRKANTVEDHTLMNFSYNEGITNAFEFNHDLFKEMNGNKGNIWTVTTDGIPVAGNSMPFSENTTTVPVGVKVTAQGDYTFALPEGTNGVGVFLVDYVTGARTNLALENYTVNLAAGQYDNRFSIEISPIAQAPTDIEQTGAGVQEDVRKVMVDGVLYIVKDGVVFDAQGCKIE